MLKSCDRSSTRIDSSPTARLPSDCSPHAQARRCRLDWVQAFRWGSVAEPRATWPLARLRLGDLDQVAAGVVEHRRRHGSHLDRFLRELDAEAAEPLELGMHV